MKKKEFYKLINLKPISTPDKPGVLVDLDINKLCLEHNIPFTITKCFYITDVNSEQRRGLHSNNNASEILVCLGGSFSVRLFNRRENVILNMKRHDLLYIKNDVWIEMYDFKNSVIMAFVYIMPTDKDSCHNLEYYMNMK